MHYVDTALVGLANPLKKKSNNLPSKYNRSEALDQQIFWIKNLWRVSFFCLKKEKKIVCVLESAKTSVNMNAETK